MIMAAVARGGCGRAGSCLERVVCLYEPKTYTVCVCVVVQLAVYETTKRRCLSADMVEGPKLQ